MSATDLVFRSQNPGTDLVFGVSDQVDIPAVGVGALALPGLGLNLRAGSIALGGMALGLPGLGMAGAAAWDSRTDRPLVSLLQGPSAESIRVPGAQLLGCSADGAPRVSAAIADSEEAVARSQGASVRFGDGVALTANRLARMGEALGRRYGARAGLAESVRRRRSLGASVAESLVSGKPLGERMAEALRRRSGGVARIAEAIRAGRLVGTVIRIARPTGTQIVVVCDDGKFPPVGYLIVPPPQPPVPYAGSTDLVFWQSLGGADLVFGLRPDTGPAARIVIPIREIYSVSNEISLFVTGTGQEIPSENLAISIDYGSWSWAWSANIPASCYPLVMSDDPTELIELTALFNGQEFACIAELPTKTRQFPDRKVSVAGKGLSAWLAAPWADISSRFNDQAKTAQQLAADALMENGVSLGWALDWQIADWLVPTGCWNHQGTPIEAVIRIAEAAGGYVQADPSQKILHVLPTYPAPPWEWGTLTPDIDLPEDVCKTESIPWQDKPRYNAVYVAGQQGGIMGHVIRDGTSGGRVAPMVTDPLITHADAARSRGTTILSQTGRLANISLSLPVLPETGIIAPGKLIRYRAEGKTYLGITRRVAAEDKFPEAWQTLEVETHVIESV